MWHAVGGLRGGRVARRGEPSPYVEWSVNEKVAFELAAGAAWAGKRALVTMKMSGANVALDAIIGVAHSGVNGGLVVYVADDPGVEAGMPEQDSRLLAQLCGLPLLDPAAPASAYRLARYAFGLSERIGLPVLLRSVTSVAHARSPVDSTRRWRPLDRPAVFRRDISRYTKAGSAICLAQHRWSEPWDLRCSFVGWPARQPHGDVNAGNLVVALCTSPCIYMSIGSDAKRMNSSKEQSAAGLKTSRNRVVTGLILTALTTLLFGCGQSEQGHPKEPFAKARHRIRKLMEQQHIASFQVAVAKDGKIIYEEAFGWANVKQKIPTTTQTMHLVASIDKPFTSTALMILAERGKIDLHGPVNAYLGDF